MKHPNDPGKHLKTIVQVKYAGGGHGLVDSAVYDHPEGMYGHRMGIIRNIRERCGASTRISFIHMEEVDYEVAEDGTWTILQRTIL